MGIELNNGYIVNNLEGQVEYNKRNIEKHFEVDRILANFGIKIIGRVDTAEDIADQTPPAGGYQYGDAYAVGEEGTVYDYYIYTRPFEGESEDQWFDIGPLQIVGPQGIQGETGEQGIPGPSTRWYIYQWSADLNNNPPNSPGDIALVKNGGKIYLAVEQNGSVVWADQNYSIIGPQGLQGNQGPTGLQGAQGAQGPQGAQGARGLGLVILGTDLASVDALPDPATVRRDGAYLIGSPKHLWAITGTTELQWEDLGEYNVTPSLPEGKLYRHTCSVRFSLWGGTTISYLPIYSTDPTPITVDTMFSHSWNSNQLEYIDSTYKLITRFSYIPDYGGDPAWVFNGIELASEYTSTWSEVQYSNPVQTIYDAVSEA